MQIPADINPVSAPESPNTVALRRPAQCVAGRGRVVAQKMMATTIPFAALCFPSPMASS